MRVKKFSVYPPHPNLLPEGEGIFRDSLNQLIGPGRRYEGAPYVPSHCSFRYVQ